MLVAQGLNFKSMEDSYLSGLKTGALFGLAMGGHQVLLQAQALVK